MRFRLEGDNFEPVDNPSWEAVDKAISSLHPKDRCYFSLNNVDTQSYVQLAGARLRITVEGRVYSDNRFRHFVFGRPERNEKEAYINCRIGSLQLIRSQVLTIEDGKSIFLHFYNNGILPNQYELQELTNGFC